MPRVLIGSIAEMRVSISRAALLVKVTARTPFGLTFPVWISQAMRVVRTRVFPEPAPARISADWTGRVTAASCSGLRFSSRLSMRAFENERFYRALRQRPSASPPRPCRRASAPPTRAAIIHAFPEPAHAAPVPPRDRRARSAGALGANLRVSRDRGAYRKRRPPEVLLPVDVPLPFGQTAYGARAQLYHRRRDDPLPSDAGFQRSSADGMGRFRSARRKRGDGERRAPGGMDLRQHRRHEAAAALARLRDRLGARARDLLARLLPLEPVAVPAHARARPRLQEDRHGELGPGRPDGARERAGDRRPRLAHGGSGREARDPDVLHGDHKIRGRAARGARLAHRLARACEDDASQLDRQEPRRQHRIPRRARGREKSAARFYHARRYPDGRDLLRTARRAPGGRA